MTAAPFTAILKFGNHPTNPDYVFQINCTVSDVATEAYIAPDGSDTLHMPLANTYLLDVILSPAYGTDTTQGAIYANQKTTGETIQNAANQATNLSRQFMGAPVGFKPGAIVKIIQA